MGAFLDSTIRDIQKLKMMPSPSNLSVLEKQALESLTNQQLTIKPSDKDGNTVVM